MKWVVGLGILCILSLPSETLAQHDHAAGADQVGSASVNFQTSCAPAVRAEFNRAVALLHSFWFAQAIAAFNGILEKDPSCAIAHWGIALSRWGNPFAGLRAPQQIDQGRAAIEKAQTTGDTERTRARVYRGRRTIVHRRPAGNAACADARLRAGDGNGRSRQPRRHGGAHLLRAGRKSDGVDDRQEIHPAVESGRDSRAALQRASDASRARALHHSRLRSPAARREGAGGGAAVCLAGAGGAARAAYAVAHVHAGRDRGRNRSKPIVDRQKRHGRRMLRRKSCTRWIIRRTRICRSPAMLTRGG